MDNRFSATQCVQISSTKLLIAVPDGRCWLTEAGSPGVTALPVSRFAATRASLATGLVEGAVFAGLSQADTLSPIAFTPQRYVQWLTGNYVFAGRMPALFYRAGERFESLGRHDLAAFARQKAKEETGHAELAYRDLEGLGLPAADTIRVLRPPSADAFLDRFRSYVESDTPVASFGFSYCLERMAAGRDEDFIRNIKAIYPPKTRAFRFLKVHSSIGADADHVDDQLSFFESLSEADLTLVTCATYETAKMLTQQPSIDRLLSDDEIDRRLQANGIEFSFACNSAMAEQRRMAN